MTFRFTSCCAGALSLHAALFALGAARPSPTSSPIAMLRDETEVELLGLTRLEPEPPAAPVAALSEPALLAPSPPRELRSRVAARAARPLGDGTPIAGAAAPVSPSAAEPDASAREPASSKRLSLAALGVTRSGNGAAFLEGMQDGPQPAKPDVGGLGRAQMAQDTELGLGPGGAVASAVRKSARELAPLDSEATFSVDLSADGSVVAVSLDGVRSNDTAWNALLRVLREQLAALSVKVRRPTRVTLRVTNQSTLRAGKPSSSPFQFDLSNIGSPTIQSLHVRVLAQTPL